MSQGKRIVLAARPVGEPKSSDFRLEEFAIPSPAAGEVLLRTIWLSLDPYMRGRMSDGPSYATPVPVGGVMEAGTVCEVIATNNPGFAKGDIVLSRAGWQTHAVSDGKGLAKVDPKLAPISTAIGVLGMPGMTAYTGLLDIGKPQEGETVVVAGASGAVGSAVGQIAKIKGAHAVGIAGGKDKCDYVVKELGFDACIDHRDPDLAAKLKDACPKGIDVYFENVGGAVFEAVLPAAQSIRARAGVRPDRALQRHRGQAAEMGHLHHACDADQAAHLPRLHRLRLRLAPWRLPARHVQLGPRRQGEVQGVHHRRSGERPGRLHRAAEGRQFRQAAGPGRAR